MSVERIETRQTGQLHIRRDGYTAWIILDRPEKRNALSPAMWAGLPSLAAELDQDPTVRVIGIRGAGRTFSAGADIGDILGCLGEPNTGLPRGGLLTEAAEALAAVRKPTVCALEGFCMGGAWMLAQACDVRVADRSLRIGLTPSRIGIIFPEAGIQSLVRLVGPGVASYLLLTGDTITAAEAEQWGMVTRVIDNSNFEDHVRGLTTDLAMRSQLSMQAQKYLIDRAARNEMMAEVNETVEDLYREVIHGPDAKIGQESFLAKKPPEFRWNGEKFWPKHHTR